jgi:hypothetical protein
MAGPDSQPDSSTRPRPPDPGRRTPTWAGVAIPASSRGRPPGPTCAARHSPRRTAATPAGTLPPPLPTRRRAPPGRTMGAARLAVRGRRDRAWSLSRQRSGLAAGMCAKSWNTGPARDRTTLHTPAPAGRVRDPSGYCSVDGQGGRHGDGEDRAADYGACDDNGRARLSRASVRDLELNRDTHASSSGDHCGARAAEAARPADGLGKRHPGRPERFARVVECPEVVLLRGRVDMPERCRSRAGIARHRHADA